MNVRVIGLLFLKDLFLARKFLFVYLIAGLAASGLTCAPNPSVSFLGFILILTVAIAAGIHFIGNLLLSETTDRNRTFVMSLPISLLDYSIGKIAVILTTYLIPWTAMLACSLIATMLLPWASRGNVIVLPAIFLFLLSGFMVQLVTAVISESVGWTICVMVACNVLLNLFLMKLYAVPEIAAISKTDDVVWPTIILQILLIEAVIVAVALATAFLFQIRKRDLV